MSPESRLLLGVLLALAIAAAGVGRAAERPRASAADGLAGERIYLEGLLPFGMPLRGARRDGGYVEGAVAACVNCHRRSGLGGGEGTIRIAPITRKYLFSRTGVQPGRPTLTEDSASDVSRAAYDDTTLAAAIRSGVGRGGRELNYLMPRYQLDDASMSALIAYIKKLPTEPSPGVTDSTLDFATIVTPEADPNVRDGMLAVLNQFIADKNAFQRGGARPLRSQGQIDYRVTRRWRLHVWTLQGAPETWDSQLQERLRAEPVFAVLSGAGGRNWEPVHRFCQSARLPCLFPNVDVPVDSERDFYSVYLSDGVLLEADVIVRRLASAGRSGRLVQVYRIGDQGDSGEAAALRLAGRAPPDLPRINLPVKTADAAALGRALGEVHTGDTLVLWLRGADLALLPPPIVGVANVYASGTLGGLEHAPLPAAWRAATRLVYPADLPAARAVRMNYPLRWFQIRQVPVVAEKAQADTYLACGIVAEAVNDMQDSFMRDFLLERIESMISRRQLSGYYPRLGLGPGQRFASKGAYLVRFASASGDAVTADGEWIVP